MKKRCCLAVAISVMFLLFLLFVFAATPDKWVECKSSCLTYNVCQNTGSGAPCCVVSDSLTVGGTNYRCCYEVGVYKWKDSVCCAATETICNDGIDNDCDTFIDCADGDCAQGSVSQNGFCCGSGCSTNGGTCADASKSGFTCTDNNCNTYNEPCRVSLTGELESTLVCSGISLSCSGGSCEYSFGAITQCDEQQPGYDYTSCTAIDSQTYFADQCSSTCQGEDRGDNICRSSTFAAGCTAPSQCNGVTTNSYSGQCSYENTKREDFCSLACEVSDGTCEADCTASAFCDEKNPGDENTDTDECCYGSCASLDCDSYDDTSYGSTDKTIAESEVTAESCTAGCSGTSCCSRAIYICDSTQTDGFYNCQSKTVEGTTYYCKYGASGYYIDETSAKPAEICNDGKDNDCDTLIDCQDTNDCHGKTGPSNSICCQSSTTATDCSSLTTGNCGERTCINNLCDVAKNTGLCPATTGSCGVFANSCSQSSGAYYCSYVAINDYCSCGQTCGAGFSCTAVSCNQPYLGYTACTTQFPDKQDCACHGCTTCPSTTTGGSKTIGSAICS